MKPSGAPGSIAHCLKNTELLPLSVSPSLVSLITHTCSYARPLLEWAHARTHTHTHIQIIPPYARNCISIRSYKQYSSPNGCVGVQWCCFNDHMFQHIKRADTAEILAFSPISISLIFAPIMTLLIMKWIYLSASPSAAGPFKSHLNV